MSRLLSGRLAALLRRALVAGGVTLCAAGPALGQTGSGGTISDGMSVFTMAASPTSSTGTGPLSADLRITGAAGTDSLFQSWWWYRVNGLHTREYCLANATAWSWSGNTGTQDFTTPEFTARATWVVNNLGTNTARVTATLAVTNTTGGPLNLAIDHYLDFDFGGNVGSNSAVLASANTIRITYASAPAPFNTLLGYFQGPGADAYQCTTFSTLRGLLSNTAINDLNNSGLPLGPADWTGAYQYNRTIPAGQGTTVRAIFGIGATIPSTCRGDFNNDGAATVQDIFDFLGAYFTGNAAADVNGVDGVTIQDIFDFLGFWFTGC
jgi:hypothetical protein